MAYSDRPLGLVPETVILALGRVRASGETNMLDFPVVVRLVGALNPEAANWLLLNKSQYVTVLTIMGERQKEEQW